MNWTNECINAVNTFISSDAKNLYKITNKRVLLQLFSLKSIKRGSVNKYSNEFISTINHSCFYCLLGILCVALETYSEQYDIIYIIDSDCIFKTDIPVSITSELFQPSTGMIYFWGKFRRNISRGPETGFTGYCKQTGGFSIARLVCDCFETGKFKQYKYWDDGYVIGQVIDEYNSGKLPKSFTQSGSLNISTLKDLVSESQHKTTRVMEIPTNILFPYIHHFKNSHKTSL